MTQFESITLSTKRLELRCMNVQDAESLFTIFSDAELMRYWSTPAWTSIQTALDMIEGDQHALESGESLRLGVTLKGGGSLIGTCSVFNLQAGNRRAEVGYAIARPHWHQGYAQEAMCAVLAYCFVELKLNRLEADIDPRNVASAKLLERLGFIKEGELRQRWIVAGEVSDSWIYGLLAQEWSA
jgi:RimJ/RimL family protein N-acetyltransferase